MTDSSSLRQGKSRKGHNTKGEENQAPLSKTRVCIKNLPPKTTERDLKEYLLNQSRQSKEELQITDCKILKNEKGKSRKVAFVGFRSEDQARHVIRTFHRAFLNMTRITVEPAVARKDADQDEHKKDAEFHKSHNDQLNNKQKDAGPDTRGDSGRKSEIDDKVDELLGLMGTNSNKQKFWSNDDGMNGSDAPIHSKTAEMAEIGHDDDDDDNVSTSGSSDSSSDSDTDSSRSKDSVGENQDHLDGNREKTTSDLDFLRSKQKHIDDLDEDAGDDVEGNKLTLDAPWNPTAAVDRPSKREEGNAKESKRSKQLLVGEDDDTVETKRSTDEDSTGRNAPSTASRLFIRNLPFETTEEELEQYFSPFGRLVECHIPVDDQKRNKGYAFVTFESLADAKEAKSKLDKVDFQGRLMHILYARPPPSNEAQGDPSKLSWKQKQELSRKEGETNTIGKASQGWSASFVRGDAVVDNLAERLGLRKGELLGVKDDLSSGDAAVRLALGETQIIEENREYFRERGVNMDVLVSANTSKGDEESIQRSKTAILVKNLPFDTRLEELTKLFHMGDAPVELMLPPSRTIALAEFKHPTDAKKAFRKLAYRRFKHVPIYLEWAPLEARKTSKETAEGSASEDVVDSETPLKNAKESAEEDDAIMEAGSEDITVTLYVKNFNFATTEDSLQKLFESEVGDIVSVRIPRKIAPTKSGTTTEGRSLSMGYGFVELPSREHAQKAIKVLQGKLVDGHAIEIAVSSKTSLPPKNNSKLALSGKKAPTKIMVRNVPFQATRTELLKLFGTYGQLRKVRLPKKFDGSHRGFAFVEFLTGKEALAAMSGLSQTHLYGRHLVLEWASEEGDNLDNLRDKAKRDATSGSPPPHNKKTRFE
jgi:multiple RNA-binding domain-containing protein 1